MDKRQQRTHTKMESIKHAALELFAAHGADRVSVDEIAGKAGVSKVTIYKYFGSKEALYTEAIKLFGEKTIAAVEEILNSDVDFLDKLKRVLMLQLDASDWVDFSYLYQIWENDSSTAMTVSEGIQSRVRALTYKFFEEGKRKGYINPDIAFDTLYLYADIFRAGLKARLIDPESPLIDKQALEKLYDLYFFGFINRK
jgi:AcrR family transcriptional regulator